MHIWFHFKIYTWCKRLDLEAKTYKTFLMIFKTISHVMLYQVLTFLKQYST